MPDSDSGSGGGTDVLGIISGFIKDVRESVNGIEEISAKLDGDRSVVCEVDNNTKLTLDLGRTEKLHGDFSDPLPKQNIGPESTDTFGAMDTGWNTGTEGRLFYGSQQMGVPLTFSVHWDNPWAGGNSGDCGLLATNSHLFDSKAIIGGGNEKAHMRFTVWPSKRKFKIQNRESRYVLDITAKSKDDHALAQTYQDNQGLNQVFRLLPIDAVSYLILNDNSLKVLDVPLDHIRDSGTLIQQFSINRGQNQQWRLKPVPHPPLALDIDRTPLFSATYTTFIIENVQSGMVLDAVKGAKQSAVSQQPENGGLNQQWYLIPDWAS